MNDVARLPPSDRAALFSATANRRRLRQEIIDNPHSILSRKNDYTDGGAVAAGVIPGSAHQPGSFQAWVAAADGDADFTRQLRRGARAGLTASGATRISGSLNFTEKYAPAFPCVETVHLSPGPVASLRQAKVEGSVPDT